jgi:hypothetical protein
MGVACSVFGKRDKSVQNVSRIAWKNKATSKSLKEALKNIANSCTGLLQAQGVQEG